MSRFIAVKTAIVAFFALALLVPFAAPAAAAPTASFRYNVSSPVAGQFVRFTFTGRCDVSPCRIQWRRFGAGSNRLGTTMGEGAVIRYAFPAAGTYSVVVKITNSTRTHGSATATRSLAVRSA